MSSDYIIIPLTKGYETRVSTEDSDLALHKWYALQSKHNTYAVRDVKGKTIMMHRLILSRKLNAVLTALDIPDHENLDTLDNRRENLRLADHSKNAMNSRSRSDNTSGYKGVSWCKRERKWRAYIMINQKFISLGYYDDPRDAHQAYCDASAKHHGEFGRTSNPD